MGHAEGMFEGFVKERIDVGSSMLFVRHGGQGRPVLLDCIPISEHLARADATFATRWWHWFF